MLGRIFGRKDAHSQPVVNPPASSMAHRLTGRLGDEHQQAFQRERHRGLFGQALGWAA
ncbi:MAG: hypothetical protein R3D44_18440 [Hyphomicrobiaceae bacterium]